MYDFLPLTFFRSHFTINLMKLINFFLVKKVTSSIYQCCGSESGSGSTGSTCFWVSRIRIHIFCQKYGSGSGFGSGSFYHHAKTVRKTFIHTILCLFWTCQRHGSADPDPHQNVMDPKHWYLQEIYLAVWSCWRNVKLCSITASHSSCSKNLLF